MVEALAGQVVEPDGDAVARRGPSGRCWSCVAHFLGRGRALAARRARVVPDVGAGVLAGPRCGLVDGREPAAALRAAARESLAALTTASGVKPNSRNRVWASAEAPKCSMLTHAPGVADEVVPAHRDARLDADAGPHGRRQDLVLVGPRSAPRTTPGTASRPRGCAMPDFSRRTAGLEGQRAPRSRSRRGRRRGRRTPRRRGRRRPWPTPVALACSVRSTIGRFWRDRARPAGPCRGAGSRPTPRRSRWRRRADDVEARAWRAARRGARSAGGSGRPRRGRSSRASTRR